MNPEKEIEEINGVYRAKEIQREPKKCHINLTNRLPLISFSDCFEHCCSEYQVITMDKRTKEAVPCLCGMPIHHLYTLQNFITKKQVQIGSECVMRINISAIKNYNESLLKKGYCSVCENKGNLCYFKNLEKHRLSKPHIKKEELFKLKRASAIEKCLEHKLKFKKCLDCHKSIDRNEPFWKTRCVKCYKIKTLCNF